MISIIQSIRTRCNSSVSHFPCQFRQRFSFALVWRCGFTGVVFVCSVPADSTLKWGRHIFVIICTLKIKPVLSEVTKGQQVFHWTTLSDGVGIVLLLMSVWQDLGFSSRLKTAPCILFKPTRHGQTFVDTWPSLCYVLAKYTSGTRAFTEGFDVWAL